MGALRLVGLTDSWQRRASRLLALHRRLALAAIGCDTSELIGGRANNESKVPQAAPPELEEL